MTERLRQSESRRKHRVARHVMTCAAAITLVFAGYCTLRSDNEIGTAAAYVTGLFFAVIAYTGRVPKIKIGDNEIDPASVALGAEITADAAKKAAASADDPKEVAAAANRTADAFSDRARRYTLMFEDEAAAKFWDQLEEAAADWEPRSRRGHVKSEGEQPDA